MRSRCDTGRRRGLALTTALVLGTMALAQPSPGADQEHLTLKLRDRPQASGGSGQPQPVEKTADWDPKATAIIVCDMWDFHHSLNATLRLEEMAPRMDQTLRALRARGVLVIHAPSSCMATYKDHPARKRAIDVPRSRSLPVDIGLGCKEIAAETKGTYPIDQSGGDNDDDPAPQALWQAKLAAMGRNPGHPWKAETDLLTIDPDVDMISDQGEEIWSILEQRKIEHVILAGVHTNMCVLGRPFGLRQMVKNGKDAVLLRDLTDTIYSPRKAPYVDHFSGTDLIVEHIEKFVCPTFTSDQVIGGTPFKYKGDTRP